MNSSFLLQKILKSVLWDIYPVIIKTMKQTNKILFGFLFGYYAIYLTENASLDAVVWASLQIAIYLIFGAAQMMQAYLFVKNECNARITRKIDTLQKFLRKIGVKNTDTVAKI